jgi:hypothetical protein
MKGQVISARGKEFLGLVGTLMVSAVLLCSAIAPAQANEADIARIKNFAGIFYDHSWNRIEKVSVRDLYDRLAKYDPGKVFAVVFDGIVTQRLIDLAKDKRVQLLVGVRLGSVSRRPEDIHILTINDIVEI